MIDFFISGTFFLIVACGVVPLLFFNFILLQLLRWIWFNILQLLHPEVEFIKRNTVRTLLDTHRNHGILSVLLCIKGPAQPAAVRRHLEELVKRRHKNGSFAFPKLREILVTKCGSYGWQKCNFDLDQNFVVLSGTFKGRPITDYNVQDYVSDIISKYLPNNAPPWQIVIIPTLEDHHYLLVKLHHVLMHEGLNIGDLLPLIPPTKQSTTYFNNKSPLVNVFKKPVAIPQLIEKLTEELTNRYNEFLCNYDPLERIKLLKNTPTLPEFFAICFITLISIFKELKRGLKVIKTDPISRLRYLNYTIEKEANKRQVNLTVFLKSIAVTVDPRNLFFVGFKMVWFSLITFFFKLPILIYNEIKAVYTCFILQYCIYPNTLVGAIYTYVPLSFNALREILYFCKTFFYAPKNIFSDILMEDEYLQTVTLCGRKCVSWSEPIKTELVKSIAKSTGLSEIEVLISGLSPCLSIYLHQNQHKIPNEMPVSMRNVNSNYIFATGQNVKPEESLGGVICMNLPIINEDRGTTLLELSSQVKNKFEESLNKQPVSYLLTLLQTKYVLFGKILPATLLGIYMKYLSRKFAISVTEVTCRYPNVTQKTIWGREVASAIYWRPPQANTCISLCLNEYADHIRLGVMCDAQLVPNHTFLSRNFAGYVQDLGRSAGVV